MTFNIYIYIYIYYILKIEYNLISKIFKIINRRISIGIYRSYKLSYINNYLDI